VTRASGHGTRAPMSGSSGSEPDFDGVVGAARIVRRMSAPTVQQPTPLNGMNHPFPFGTTAGGESIPGAPRMVERPAEKVPPAREFKFASAVNIPTKEEMDRRGKEQLLVSGTIKGSDGKGMASVLVYLTDGEGNRHGQSGKSMPDTGEFKVLANAPGRYVLNVYRRGYTLDHQGPFVIPIESGRLEGVNLRMELEGCTIEGRVVSSDGGTSPEGLEVSCECIEDGFSKVAVVDSSGAFAVHGVPHDASCSLEIRAKDGAPVLPVENFVTDRRKEIRKEFTIPPLQRPARQADGDFAPVPVTADSAAQVGE
jgi:hypothetical protein